MGSRIFITTIQHEKMFDFKNVDARLEDALRRIVQLHAGKKTHVTMDDVPTCVKTAVEDGPTYVIFVEEVY